jgi:hypothetical protein
MLSLQILSTEGCFVGICWEHLNPKGPKGLLFRDIMESALRPTIPLHNTLTQQDITRN